MQDRMRNALSMFFVMGIGIQCYYVAHSAYHHDLEDAVTGSIWMIASSLALLCVQLPHLKRWFHAKLTRRMESRTSKAAAAGIAGLLGDCSVKEALKQAKGRFRCIVVSKLSCDDFRISPTAGKPCHELFNLTEVCTLDGCDAFLSHSWHDPAELRWNALQRWRDCFVEQHQREPRIWFDKACVNQADIEQDLRGLPLFLSCSEELLILCGHTYLHRLWCVMELFTFIHSGGNVPRVTIEYLSNDTEAQLNDEDDDEIRQQIKTFDAASCQCFSAADKKKMLPIMTAAFGSMDRFNIAVRSLLTAAYFGESDISD